MTSNALLTKEKLAEELGLPVRTVRTHTDTGKIPFKHLGKLVRYRLAAVSEAIDEFERPAVKPPKAKR